MRLRSNLLQAINRGQPYCQPLCLSRRRLVTLAIETSCDDTSVAIVEKHTHNGRFAAQLHFHKKVTSNNTEYQGIHPLVTLQSHQQNLANLIDEAIGHLPLQHGSASKLEADSHIPSKRFPDFISVTRGPGMRSNLSVGLDTAKGLAVAWQKPLIGVHHMQAHALTPRLVSALAAYRELLSSPNQALPHDSTPACAPTFPFLSVLASGGHTLLIHSKSLDAHRVLGTTQDIAIGECLDKIARVALPAEILEKMKSTMYGALLESFAFPPNQPHDEKDEIICTGSNDSQASPSYPTTIYTAGSYVEKHQDRYGWSFSNHEEAIAKNETEWGWTIHQPLTTSGGGNKINSLEMSFSGLLTGVERIVQYGVDPATKKLNKSERVPTDISLRERQDIAREAMRAAFEHVASRIALGMQSLEPYPQAQAQTQPHPAVVIAGGVAANSFFRHILAATLCAKGYSHAELHFPPPHLCTDNAAMIGWTGLEMFAAGHSSPLSIRAIRKWPLDQLLDANEDG